MVAGKKNWVCTDPDCVQFRREAPEHGHNVFELAQVNQYGAGLFRVAHGFVYLDNDLDGHERDLLCELYDWDAEKWLTGSTFWTARSLQQTGISPLSKSPIVLRSSARLTATLRYRSSP